MDVERAMQFILERQAAHDAEIAEIRAILKHQAATQVKTDRRVDAIAKLLQTGMKMLVKFEKENKERFKALTEAQLRTDRKVELLIDSLRRMPRNGHGPRR